MMIKVTRNKVVKEIPKEYLGIYLKAGWVDIKEDKKK